jgi:hypothetical protein
MDKGYLEKPEANRCLASVPLMYLLAFQGVGIVADTGGDLLLLPHRCAGTIADPIAH